MKDDGPYPDEPNQSEKHSAGEWDLGGCSFSSLMARNQDISFGTAPVICDVQSPTFACRSSFSSFLVEPSMPCFVSGGFSFCSSGDSNALEFSPPVSSMPSFVFFSPDPVIEQGSCILDFSTNMSRDAIHRGNQVSFFQMLQCWHRNYMV